MKAPAVIWGLRYRSGTLVSEYQEWLLSFSRKSSAKAVPAVLLNGDSRLRAQSAIKCVGVILIAFGSSNSNARASSSVSSHLIV